jgi:hypothetical protein
MIRPDVEIVAFIEAARKSAEANWFPVDLPV